MHRTLLLAAVVYACAYASFAAAAVYEYGFFSGPLVEETFDCTVRPCETIGAETIAQGVSGYFRFDTSGLSESLAGRTLRKYWTRPAGVDSWWHMVELGEYFLGLDGLVMFDLWFDHSNGLRWHAPRVPIDNAVSSVTFDHSMNITAFDIELWDGAVVWRMDNARLRYDFNSFSPGSASSSNPRLELSSIDGRGVSAVPAPFGSVLLVSALGMLMPASRRLMSRRGSVPTKAVRRSPPVARLLTGHSRLAGVLVGR